MSSKIDRETIDKLFKQIQLFVYDIAVVIENLKNIDEHINKRLMNPIAGFLMHYRKMGVSHCVITAYKIFCSKEFYSMPRLLNKIISEKLSEDILAKLDENRLRNIENGDNLVSNAEEFKMLSRHILRIIEDRLHTIEPVMNARSKVFAHLDRDYEHYDNITVENLESLQSLCVDVYKRFDGDFNDSEFIFSHNVYTIRPVLDDRIFHFETLLKIDREYHNK